MTRPMVAGLFLALAVLMAAVGLTVRALPSPPSGAAPGLSVERDFRMAAYQGEELLGDPEVSFSQVVAKGKPVVLNFWAGQCPPCRAEMPHFQRVADKFAGRVLFVGLDVGVFTGLGTHEDGRRLLQELGIRYPAGYALDASPLEIYSVRSMPTTVFLSATGQVMRTWPGAMTESQLRGLVEELVAADSSSGSAGQGPVVQASRR